MESSNLDLNNTLLNSTQNIEDTRKLQQVNQCIWNLLHACHCIDINCKSLKCRRMKKIIQHTKSCQNRVNDHCTICKQLVTICCQHSKNCQEIECPIPFCASVKRIKLEHKKSYESRDYNSVRRKRGATSIQEMESKRRMDRASRAKKTLRKLVDILKSSDRTDKQNQIIHMIRNNPSLVNVLMKLREALTVKRQVSTGSIVMSVRQRKAQILQRKRRQQQQLLSSKYQEQNPEQSERKNSIKELTIRQLIHACQCNNMYCQLDKCQMMKRIVQHIQTCKRRTSGGCAICKKVVALCCHHSRYCENDENCSVPFCHAVKLKLQCRRCDTIVQVQKEGESL